MKKTALLLAALATSSQALDLYVSPTGNDSQSGEQSSPLATIAKAKEKARPFLGKETVNINLEDGIYYLADTLKFSPEDSGSAEFPFTIKALNEGQAVLSGGSALKLDWSEYQNGIFQAKTPEGLKIDQLFIEGTNQRMARYPNYDASKKAEPYQGYSPDAFSKEKAAGWADPTGAYIHAMHRGQWGGYHFIITGKDAAGEVTYEGGWQNNRRSSIHEEYRMVENIFEELDAPGEWYHNAKTSTLYYMPTEGIDLSSAKVEVVRLPHLIEFNGSEENTVSHITLSGVTVRHAARTFMDTKEQMVRSDWTIYRGGAIFLTGTEHISILDSEFDQVGGNAVFVSNYNRNALVKGCHIHHTGASGVCFVGDPDALYNPLFEYGEKNDLSKIDLTKGPKTNNYPMDCEVADCLITNIGTVERQPAGIQIEMAAKITARDCSIYDTARAGINIGDGAFGGHLIERLDVFDTVLETHDHGSFNSWGRDRYWRHDHLTASQQAVDANPELPFLDAIYTTTIRDSRWRCDHGWDIDLDDGSTNYDIYNNLMIRGGLKLREGFRRKAWNNIILNNGLSSHVWFNNSKDSVTGNIMARCNNPYVVGDVDVSHLVDKNFYYQADQASLERVQNKSNWDHNSLFGDAMFVDPENGDFRVKEGSPAFEIGFKNFPMDQFGVKKPSLKAIARTPEIPYSNPKKQAASSVQPAKPLSITWLGGTLTALKGEEFSAYGVKKKDGGVAIRGLKEGATALKYGIQDNDLVQGINGKKVSTVEQFIAAVANPEAKTLELKLVRNQQAASATVPVKTITEYETIFSQKSFTHPSIDTSKKVVANINLANSGADTLTDGKLADDFGAVFSNGVTEGMFRMDLGKVSNVQSITSWAFKKGSSRGDQKITIFASAADKPGWDLTKYEELGLIDTSNQDNLNFSQATLKSSNSKSLGQYRWILWKAYPISPVGENTSFQEFAVETK